MTGHLVLKPLKAISICLCAPLDMAREKFSSLARSILVLCVCAFSGFMLIIAPIELMQVQKAHTWRPAPARLVASGVDYPGMDVSDGPSVWYRLTRLSDGRMVEVRDVRPGDLPFRISVLNADLFNTARGDLSRIRATYNWVFYQAPGGGKAYLEPGSYTPMSVILTLSLMWWGWVILRRQPLSRS